MRTIDRGEAADGRDAELARLLADVAPNTWDNLVGRNFYSSAAWLGFCTTDFGADSDAVVAFTGGRPTSAVPYVRVDDSLFSTYRWHDLLTGFRLPAPPPQGLLVGPREGYQTHLLGSVEGTEALLCQLRGVTRKGEACVAMYLSTADALALHHAGATPMPVLLEADAWFEVPADGWPSGLPKHRRERTRYEINRFRKVGYRVERVPLVECCEQLGELACNTLVKYGSDTDPEAELRSLRNHARCMGDAARTTLLRTTDGTIVGFCLYYVWRDTIFLRWSGFDYDHLAGVGEYFNLVYYAQLQQASELGVRWLHAGVRSIEAKAIRRARLRPLWLVDLTEGSPLHGAEREIRAHNTYGYDQLKANPQTASALDEELWRPFCQPFDWR